MTYTIEFRNDDSICLTKLSGDLEYSVIVESFEERIKDLDRFKKVKFMISDYTGASVDKLDSGHVQSDITLSNKAAQINSDLIMIGIVSDPYGYGLGRMWMTYADTLPWKSFLVKTVKEAEEIMLNEGFDFKIESD